MKKILTLLLVFIATSSFAQVKLEVIETKKTFSKGNHTGYIIGIPNGKLKTIASDWKKYLVRNNKGKVSVVDGEYVLSKIPVTEISSDSIMIYSMLSQRDSSVELVAFITNDNSTFLSSAEKPDVTTAFTTYIRNFAVNEYKNVVTLELKTEQEKLKDLQESLADLEKANEQAEKKIKNNTKENEKSESEIKENQKLKEIKSDAILQQQKILATFTESSDRKKEEEKNLKNLEKEKKNVDKEIDSMHNDVDKNEDENKELQKKIDKNNSELIPAKKAEIEKQKEVVAAVDMKLKEVR